MVKKFIVAFFLSGKDQSSNEVVDRNANRTKSRRRFSQICPMTARATPRSEMSLFRIRLKCIYASEKFFTGRITGKIST
jgi:hypothetical protein